MIVELPSVSIVAPSVALVVSIVANGAVGLDSVGTAPAPLVVSVAVGAVSSS